MRKISVVRLNVVEILDADLMTGCRQGDGDRFVKASATGRQGAEARPSKKSRLYVTGAPDRFLFTEDLRHLLILVIEVKPATLRLFQKLAEVMPEVGLHLFDTESLQP